MGVTGPLRPLHATLSLPAAMKHTDNRPKRQLTTVADTHTAVASSCLPAHCTTGVAGPRVPTAVPAAAACI
jgi:hypothetical protein